MISIFSFILAGIIVGYLTRRRTYIRLVSSIITLVIIFLLFVLGVAVGANKQIVEGFASIGIDAFAIATACTIGSVLTAWFVYIRFFKDKKRMS